MGLNKALIAISRSLFAYQIFAVVRPKPTLASLLDHAQRESGVRAAASRDALTARRDPAVRQRLTDRPRYTAVTEANPGLDLPKRAERSQPAAALIVATLDLTPSLFVALVLVGRGRVGVLDELCRRFRPGRQVRHRRQPEHQDAVAADAAMSAPPEMPVSGRPVASLTLAINYALAPAEVRDVLSPGGPSAPARRARTISSQRLGLSLLQSDPARPGGAGAFWRGATDASLGSADARASARSRRALAFVAALSGSCIRSLTDAVTYVVQRTEVLMGLFFFLTLYCSIRAGEPGSARTVAMVDRCRDCRVCARHGQQADDGRGAVDRVVVGLDVSAATQSRCALSRRCATPVAAVCGSRRDVGHSGGARRDGTVAALDRIRTRGLDAVDISPDAERRDRPLSAAVRSCRRRSRSITTAGRWRDPVLRCCHMRVPILIAARRDDMRDRPAAAVGFLGGWFFATLAPSSSVLPLATEIAAERRMYLPLAALVVASLCCLSSVGQKRSRGRGDGDDAASTGWWRLVAALTVAAVVRDLGVGHATRGIVISGATSESGGTRSRNGRPIRVRASVTASIFMRLADCRKPSAS